MQSVIPPRPDRFHAHPHFSNSESSGEALNKPILRSDISSGAKQAAEKLEICGLIGGKCPSAAKANVDSAGVMRGLKPPPPSASSFSAACEAQIHFAALRHATQRVPRSCLFKAPTYAEIS
jgi:hypothetical protein